MLFLWMCVRAWVKAGTARSVYDKKIKRKYEPKTDFSKNLGVDGARGFRPPQSRGSLHLKLAVNFGPQLREMKQKSP